MSLTNTLLYFAQPANRRAPPATDLQPAKSIQLILWLFEIHIEKMIIPVVRNPIEVNKDYKLKLKIRLPIE